MAIHSWYEALSLDELRCELLRTDIDASTSRTLKAEILSRSRRAVEHGPISEIQYANPEGEWVHSDLDPADREHMHAELDEYLDKSNNGQNGFFYVANSRDISAEFNT